MCNILNFQEFTTILYAHMKKVWKLIVFTSYSEKVIPLIQANSFPLLEIVEKAFEYLKVEIENAIVNSIDEVVLFTIETNASYHSIATSLNQSGRLVAFFLRAFKYQ